MWILPSFLEHMLCRSPGVTWEAWIPRDCHAMRKPKLALQRGGVERGIWLATISSSHVSCVSETFLDICSAVSLHAVSSDYNKMKEPFENHSAVPSTLITTSDNILSYPLKYGEIHCTATDIQKQGRGKVLCLVSGLQGASRTLHGLLRLEKPY